MCNLGEPIKMLPEPVPTLEGKEAKRFIREIQKPPSKKDLATFAKAEKVYRNIKPIK